MALGLKTIANDYWQAGVLPDTGASLAFGRVRHGDTFVDVMRPTAESDYGNASLCASFIMLPWANRLRNARFRFRGQDYPLEVTNADGTAIHGTVRKLPWRILSEQSTQILMAFDSAAHDKLNYPFAFSAHAEYRLEANDFVWKLRLKNADTCAIPVGFGHHPYFLKQAGSMDSRVHLEIPYDQQYTLIDDMAVSDPGPIQDVSDFRRLRPLGDDYYSSLFTGRQSTLPMRIVYPELNVELHLMADPVFAHTMLYAPLGKPFFAVEPQTNANDGFNLYDQSIRSSGVIVLEPGDEIEGECCLRLVQS